MFFCIAIAELIFVDFNLKHSFRCPKNGDIRDRWIESIKSHQSISPEDEKSLSYVVCSNHFHPSEMKGNPSRLKPGTYPTLFPTLSNEYSINDEEFPSNNERNENPISNCSISNDSSNQ